MEVEAEKDMSGPQGPLDGVRAKELYKYFKPSTFNTLSASKAGIPDTILASYAQLIAWRLNMDRALVSLIDRETQYFVAESTKTLHLDTGLADDPTDAVWAGCINVPKAGRLCECTLEASPAMNGSPPSFEVCDLTKDARFNKLPFVTSGPQFRYYIGVPIKTRLGVAIGSLFAMDKKPRCPISDADKQFMTVIAKNVMTHLELVQEREDRKRATGMNMYLSEFIDPKNYPRKRNQNFSVRSMERTSSKGPSEAPSRSDNSSDATLRHHGHPYVRERLSSGTSSQDSTVTDSDAAMPVIDDTTHMDTFRRAAELLYDSLSLNEGGGVVFLDDSSSGVPVSGLDRRGSYSSVCEDHRESNVLASTSSDDSVDETANKISAPFTSMPASSISGLVKRYPHGKLFTLDPEILLQTSSSSDESGMLSSHRKPRKQRLHKEADVKLLQRHFPTARQMVFIPIWDAVSDCWSACFLYNCSDYRTITTTEFLFCVTFCNSIAGEFARLAAVNADKQKQSFIGSVSHELRSPLHGILGAMEFLVDTDCTSFQRSLIDTASSCAGNLLDMVQQILDFSKSTASHWTKYSSNLTDVVSKPGPSQDLDPHLHAPGYVDLAVITEEVVEGIMVGQTPRSLSALESGRGHETLNQGYASKKVKSSDVQVILDIAPRLSWAFETQPGAFRRIVMNLVGNSLKYTQSGYIRIGLTAIDMAASNHQRDTDPVLVTLTVEDTGCGISRQFMRTRLFVPFSQESTLNPGTGLGLSLVKQLVKSMNGEIRVNSTVNVGTEVFVQLPLEARRVALDTVPKGLMTSQVKDDEIPWVQRVARGKSVSLYGSLSSHESSVASMSPDLFRSSLKTILVEWLLFSSVYGWHEGEASDVVIAHEHDLISIFSTMERQHSISKEPLVIVLCYAASRPEHVKSIAGKRNFELVTMPIGPHKLAKAIRCGLPRIEGGTSPIRTTAQSSVTHAVAQSVARIKLGHADDGRAHDLAVPELQTLASSSQAGTGSLVSQPPSQENLQLTELKMELRQHTSTEVQHPQLPSPTAITSFDEVSRTPIRPDSAGKDQRQGLRHPRILLVDDNHVNLRLINMFMQKRSYESVHLAHNGEEAVTIYKELILQDPPVPPDIIFMDINMPVLDGFAATRKIRQIELEVAANTALTQRGPPPAALVIALTGLADEKDRSKAFGSGIDQFMTKPVSFRGLGKLLDSWLEAGHLSTDTAL